MSRQIPPAQEPTLEDVQAQFEVWRNTRPSRKPIPDKLWQAAVELTRRYPTSKIAKSLRLNHARLNDRIQATKINPPQIKDPLSKFVELDFCTPAMSSECTIEMKDRNGAQMRIHLKGQNDLTPIEICRTFWSKVV